MRTNTLATTGIGIVVAAVVSVLGWWVSDTVASGLLGAILVVVSLVLAIDAANRKSGTGLLLCMGLLVLFIGERVFGEGTLRLPVSGIGLLIVLGAMGIRA